MVINRLEKVRSLLKAKGLEAMLIDRPVDLFYLTNMELSLGRLVVEPEQTTLFVDGRYYEMCKNNLPFQVILTRHFEKGSAFANWGELTGKSVGFDGESTPYAEYERLRSLNAHLSPQKNPIKTIREIKDSQEIGALREAASLGSQGYDYLLTLLKEGISERALARELEIFWIKSGGDRLAFPPHIAFGEGSSQPHYHSADRKLKQGDTVLMDIGVVCRHYHSDMTRVVFNGPPREEIEKIYPIVLQAYQNAVALCQPGQSIASIDRAARDVIDDAGYKNFFTHSLGHGVGLEIHELPRMHADTEESLKAGMVLTIEPGIYLPGIGGVRLEDTLLITQTGYENLTQRSLQEYPIL